MIRKIIRILSEVRPEPTRIALLQLNGGCVIAGRASSSFKRYTSPA
jgi:hypothetical protein